MATVTGRVEVRVNGESLLIKQGAKAIGIGGYKRRPVEGEEYHGYVEEVSTPRCEFSITDRNDKALEELASEVDATLVFQSANDGKVYVMKHAVCEGGFELTAGEGEVPVAFFGPSWSEQLA